MSSSGGVLLEEGGRRDGVDWDAGPEAGVLEWAGILFRSTRWASAMSHFSVAIHRNSCQEQPRLSGSPIKSYKFFSQRSEY